MTTGELSERVRFQKRQALPDDPEGAPSGPWQTHWECWAGFRPQFAREALAAGRTEGTLRGSLKVRRCAESLAVTASDRVVFIAGGYTGSSAALAAPTPLRERDYIEFPATIGGPDE